MSTRRTPRSLEERVADLEEHLRRALADAASTPSDLRLLLDARGDLIVALDNDRASRLGVGRDGQVLTARPSTKTLGMAWETFAALAASLVTAKGDLIVGDADGDAATLAVGADGDVLTADSSSPVGQSWVSSSTSNAEVLAWLSMTEGT